MMNRHGTQRGSVLIYALLMVAAMLAISLSISAIFLAKLRSIGASRDSAVALYAADSGAEFCLYGARTGDALTSLALDTVGAKYAIADATQSPPAVVADCTTLGTASFQFRVVGSYRSVSRAIEVSQ